jgi:hypothetical protein
LPFAFPAVGRRSSSMLNLSQVGHAKDIAQRRKRILRALCAVQANFTGPLGHHNGAYQEAAQYLLKGTRHRVVPVEDL